MSLWRWTRTLSFSAAAVVAALTLPPFFGASADDSTSVSSGPVSTEEAAILWKDGKADFDRGLYEDAIPKLERFVARYPGYPEYFVARHLLAQSYLRLHEPAKAMPELRAFIQARGHSAEALHARLELARAQLELKLFQESLLTAEETLKLALKSELHEARAEALILRARAEIGLDQDDRARTSAGSAQKAFPHPPPTGLAGELGDVQLELRLRQCLKFPSKGKLEEAQVRDQLSRRGNCLLDSLLTFKQVLDTQSAPDADRGATLVSDAYDAYWLKCLRPPEPPAVHPKDRNALQLKTYFRELAVVLEEDCRQKIHEGLNLVQGWKNSVPARAQESLNRAVAVMEKLK